MADENTVEPDESPPFETGPAPMVRTSRDMEVLLLERFPLPQWVLLTGVGNTTGFADQRRTADALALNTWPSRGLELIGFEIKVHRSDWQRELDHPEKADPIWKYCDRWYVVTNSSQMIRAGELPPTWGHMTCSRSGKLRIAVEAPLNTAVEPWPRNFIASLLRNAATKSKSNIDAKEVLAAEYKKGFDQGVASVVNYEIQQLRQTKEAVDKFRDASGVDIEHTWMHGDISAVVQSLRHGGIPSLIKDLGYASNQLGNAHESAKQALLALNELVKIKEGK